MVERAKLEDSLRRLRASVKEVAIHNNMDPAEILERIAECLQVSPAVDQPNSTRKTVVSENGSKDEQTQR